MSSNQQTQYNRGQHRYRATTKQNTWKQKKIAFYTKQKQKCQLPFTTLPTKQWIIVQRKRFKAVISKSSSSSLKMYPLQSRKYFTVHWTLTTLRLEHIIKWTSCRLRFPLRYCPITVLWCFKCRFWQYLSYKQHYSCSLLFARCRYWINTGISDIWYPVTKSKILSHLWY